MRVFFRRCFYSNNDDDVRIVSNNNNNIIAERVYSWLNGIDVVSIRLGWARVVCGHFFGHFFHVQRTLNSSFHNKRSGFCFSSFYILQSSSCCCRRIFWYESNLCLFSSYFGSPFINIFAHKQNLTSTNNTKENKRVRCFHNFIFVVAVSCPVLYILSLLSLDPSLTS